MIISLDWFLYLLRNERFIEKKKRWMRWFVFIIWSHLTTQSQTKRSTYPSRDPSSSKPSWSNILTVSILKVSTIKRKTLSTIFWRHSLLFIDPILRNELHSIDSSIIEWSISMLYAPHADQDVLYFIFQTLLLITQTHLDTHILPGKTSRSRRCYRRRKATHLANVLRSSVDWYRRLFWHARNRTNQLSTESMILVQWHDRAEWFQTLFAWPDRLIWYAVPESTHQYKDTSNWVKWWIGNRACIRLLALLIARLW